MSELYDALSRAYRGIAARRAAYLAAVDRLVLERAAGAASLLDVGAADGVRGLALARALGASRVALCEPSAEMARACRELDAGGVRLDVWQCGAADMPDTGESFDACLCLWNVLGHVDGGQARVAALSAMRRRLAPGGSLFLDVNNRHNAAAYGFWNVLGRRALDALAWDERRGDAAVAWDVGGTTVRGKGHLFTPAEMDRLFSAAGLRAAERLGVDYADGAVTASPHRGQLFYRLVQA